jgi:hypothetical protein
MAKRKLRILDFGFWIWDSAHSHRLTFTVFGSLLIATSAAAQISPGKLSRYHVTLEGIAACTSCHELGKELTDEKCLACHDALKSRIDAGKGYHTSSEVTGKHCFNCHSEHGGREFEPIDWKGGQTAFNHDPPLADWKLEGKHRTAECRACHNPGFIADESVKQAKSTNPSRTFLGLDSHRCTSCHQNEHGNQLPSECLNCHSAAADAWKPAPGFSHDRAAYPLTGKHNSVVCVKCHASIPAYPADNPHSIRPADFNGRTLRYKGLSFASCSACHTDPHQSRFGTDCAKCHKTSGFHDLVNAGSGFDHTKTDFPLAGKHQTVACKLCHTSGNMTRPLNFAQCTGCHKDPHHSQFARRSDGGVCESCHSVNGFIPANFDIAQHQAGRFQLTGAHLAVPCAECHKSVTSISGELFVRFEFASSDCRECHRDIHRGEVDPWLSEKSDTSSAAAGCAFCHTTDSWCEVSFDHDRAAFKLVGKHRSAACSACHRQGTGQQESVVLKKLNQACAGCHRDVHYSQFIRIELGEKSPACDRCHIPDGWRELIFEHNRDARFKLDGAHAALACSKCHKTTASESGVVYIVYRPVGTSCADCHGALPPKSK